MRYYYNWSHTSRKAECYNQTMPDITHTCTQCGKKFLVIPQEQEFLRKKSLPLPTLCPTDRQARRLAFRGERSLFRTTCQNCGANVVTSYDPVKATSKILCQKCYVEYYDKNDALIK